MLPNARPRLSSAELHKRLESFSIDREKYPLIIVGIRGYYKNSMGKPAINDRGIYDDAIFMDSPSVTVSYNGNTDPAKYRKGYGKTNNKGMASLKPGIYYSYKFDYHRSSYLALCQTAGPVTVIRDGDSDYEDTGYFGINIHRGGDKTTGSEGCQTIPPEQWASFIQLAIDQAKRVYGDKWQSEIIPYVLLEEP